MNYILLLGRISITNCIYLNDLFLKKKKLSPPPLELLTFLCALACSSTYFCTSLMSSWSFLTSSMWQLASFSVELLNTSHTGAKVLGRQRRRMRGTSAASVKGRLHTSYIMQRLCGVFGLTQAEKNFPLTWQVWSWTSRTSPQWCS